MREYKPPTRPVAPFAIPSPLAVLMRVSDPTALVCLSLMLAVVVLTVRIASVW
jgi:hypothetical protein